MTCCFNAVGLAMLTRLSHKVLRSGGSRCRPSRCSSALSTCSGIDVFTYAGRQALSLYPHQATVSQASCCCCFVLVLS